jgi:serine/threonine-protein kinase
LLLTDGTPKISDFGLGEARQGEPDYLAPEQASSAGQLGPFTDVYALGAILYECLTGRPPFRAATPSDTLEQVVNDDPLPPSWLVPKIPPALEAITLRCLRKERARRYARAETLADDLRRSLAGPTDGSAIGFLEQMRRWARRWLIRT